MTQKSGQVALVTPINKVTGVTTEDQINCLSSAIYYESTKDLDAQITAAKNLINSSNDYMNVCTDLSMHYHENWIEISKQKNDQSIIVARNIYWLRFHSTQEQGINLIIRSEGFANHAYNDVGYYSIGFGTLLRNKKLYDAYRYKIIDQDEGERLLIDEVINIEVALKSMVKVPLTPNQEAALTSFCYNVGLTHFVYSKMLNLLNAGQYANAANEFQRWNLVKRKVSEGLVARRAAERKLFLKN
jgi:lysozyme